MGATLFTPGGTWPPSTVENIRHSPCSRGRKSFWSALCRSRGVPRLTASCWVRTAPGAHHLSTCCFWKGPDHARQVNLSALTACGKYQAGALPGWDRGLRAFLPAPQVKRDTEC